jgi:hypothetical protein
VDSENAAADQLGFAEGQQTGSFYMADLADALTDIDILKLIVDLDITGEGNLTLSDIDVTLGNVVSGLLQQLGVDPKIVITLPDFNDLSNISVSGFDLGSIADGFDDLNFSSVFDALRSIVNLLQNFTFFDFFDEPLPVIGVTLSEVLDYLDKFHR